MNPSSVRIRVNVIPWPAEWRAWERVQTALLPFIRRVEFRFKALEHGGVFSVFNSFMGKLLLLIIAVNMH